MRSVNGEMVAVVEVTACVRLRVLFEQAKDFVSLKKVSACLGRSIAWGTYCCLTESIERSHDVRCDTLLCHYSGTNDDFRESGKFDASGNMSETIDGLG